MMAIGPAILVSEHLSRSGEGEWDPGNPLRLRIQVGLSGFGARLKTKPTLHPQNPNPQNEARERAKN